MTLPLALIGWISGGVGLLILLAIVVVVAFAIWIGSRGEPGGIE